MIHQKNGRRALCAVAFAAAPIGALASPLVSAPHPRCDGAHQLSEISWQNGSFVRGNTSVLGGGSTGKGTVGIDLTAYQLATKGEDTKGGFETKTELPFTCSLGIGGKTGAETKAFASVEFTSGESFSIDFGPLEHTGGVNFVPTFTAFDYLLSGIGTKGESKEWVTDFNLYLTGSDLKTDSGLYKDFLGVQVISGTSALSKSDDLFFTKNGQLMFDPTVSGLTKVSLFSTPFAPAGVPEPGSLALMAAGLLGLGALTRRRTRDEAGGGEPEA